MARRETARSDQIFGFGEQFAGKSERDAESKHKENSSEQRQADYDAKMSNESKSNRTGRQNNGHPQSEATTTPGGRLPQHHSLDKIKKIPGPHLSESGGSLLEQKSKHPVGATQRWEIVLRGCVCKGGEWSQDVYWPGFSGDMYAKVENCLEGMRVQMRRIVSGDLDVYCSGLSKTLSVKHLLGKTVHMAIAKTMGTQLLVLPSRSGD